MSTAIDALVAGANESLAEYASFTQEQIDRIVRKASVAALSKHGDLAMLAVEETGRGLFEDKAVKNMFACEHVTHSIIKQRTVGVISTDEITGITEIAEPVGVIAGITPVTNPTSTTIFKSLIALKTRNPIIFAFHPSAQRSSVAAAQIVREAAVAAGAPANCIQWVEEPSLEASGELMNHPGVALILATGGNAMVRAAYSCGKPALGVGAGNVPAFIEKTAKVGRAVNDIVLSKAFDNGMVCASEQAVILEAPIADEALAEFERLHAYRANADEKRMLEEFIFGVSAEDANCAEAKLNAKVVGQSPVWIARNAGFEVPEDTSIILAEVGSVGPQEPLTREKLAPVLAVLRAKDAEEGIDLAVQMVAFDGLGHSGAIHSTDADVIARFASRVQAVRIIENAPSALGGIGDIYNAFMPSLTLGCGSYGRNSVSNNVSAVNLLNIKRVGRRNNNLQWFKVPAKTYFEPNAIRYLIDMKNVRAGHDRHRRHHDEARLRRQGHRRAQPPSGPGAAADHRPGPARADRLERAGRRRRDARVQARHDHRARWRIADGCREGHVAALREPGRAVLRHAREVLRRAQARVQVPRPGQARTARVHPDHVGHRFGDDPVRGDHRRRDGHEVPARRLRAHPVGRDHRPRADRGAAGFPGGGCRIRRADARHRGVRLGVRERLHRRARAARDQAHLPEHRAQREGARRDRPIPPTSSPARRCTTPRRSRAWRSATRSSGSCTRWPTSRGRSSTSCTVAPTRSTCRT